MPRRKVKGIAALAQALAVIAADSQAIESKADRVLAIVKTSGIRDGKAFNKAVRDAYAANGWNVKPGKPKKGAKNGAVPATVKQYVSTVRAAFKASIEPWKMSTFHALRKAVSAARAKAKPKEKATDARLEGVRLVHNGGKLTGAPFHDLALMYEKLNRQQQAQMAAELQGIIKKFTPAAVAVAPELVLMKAA